MVSEGKDNLKGKLSELYRIIFETTPAATMIVDNTTISLVNKEFERLSGYSRQQVEGKKNWMEFVAEEDLERMKEYHRLRRIDPDVAPRNYEFRFLDREGNIRNIFMTIAVVPGTKKIVASLLDITEYKKIEENLRESKERYRILVENANEAILVVQDNTVKFANPKTFQASGYSKEEIFSTPFVEFIHPEDRKAIMDRYLMRIRGKELAHTQPVRFITRKGDIKWVEFNAVSIKWEGEPALLVLAIDITERRKEEKELAEERELLQQLMDNIPDSIYFKDRDNRFIRVNKAKARHSNTTPEEMVGKTDFDFLPHEEARKAFLDERKVVKSGNPIVNKIERITHADGKQYWVSVTKVPRYNMEGEIVGTLGISRDITEQREREKQLSYIATHDTLTGLANRPLFNDRLSLAMARARRERYSFPIMLFDLDDFKDINDTLGHTAGDRLLQAVAVRLNKILRGTDTIARMGGDEFLLLLPEAKTREATIAVARKVLAVFQKPFLIEAREIKITVSIGIAFYPTDGKDGDSLIKNADIAMYQAKDKGKNNFQFFYEE